MEPDPVVAALERLAPSAQGRAPVRVRIGVGAAVLLLILSLATAVVLSAVGQQAGHQVVAPSDSVGGQSGRQEVNADIGSDSSAAPHSGSIIFVHVLGAVRRPGLFELSSGARVMDAVAAAGGLTETADPSGANLARKLTDGEQLYLPQVGEVLPGPPTGSGAAGGAAGTGAAGGVAVLINLNTATLADLDTLPRIGPAMAQRILDYREANGPFAVVDDLRNVTGIGEKTFEGLSTLVTV
ncbi:MULTISPECIES: helix-hairpin-helix domain-containing protein [Cryobacterium]|uniref:Helix-hairpin-helix domain-containing protein n=1 Tax=Cryobacterium breve TaxID=1259258 RepID=A0ABY2J000_9MICO|nr:MULTISPECIES: helix-hairpin-helix domain-containing protein [Cryobacterium]TFC96693.1 helix-hairpin-helix domain-containing protein [Cryobacterium sp. TmT3-12]TFC97510.1 helix-hairpin-helix domain-containing protein [Cryobacterium breve]